MFKLRLEKYRRLRFGVLTKQYNVKLPDDLAEELEHICIELDMTPPEFIRLLIYEEITALKKERIPQNIERYQEVSISTEAFAYENRQLRKQIEQMKKELDELKKINNVTQVTLEESEPQPVRSPLIWFGGKSKLAKHIIDFMPSHKAYVEPFGGGGHVLSQKEPVEYEVYNDIDGDLVNFLLVCREDPEKLAQACETLPYSRQLYEEWRDSSMPDDPFERAVRFFYINRSGIAKGNGPGAYRPGWRHSAKVNPARAYHSAIELFQAFANRLKYVQIESRDFREIIRVYDTPDTLFYVDPPYIGREKYYAGGFTEQDHRDLANMLNNIKGKVIISYYDDPLLNELYPNWRRENLKASRQVIGAQKRPEAEEILLMNFEDHEQVGLFS